MTLALRCAQDMFTCFSYVSSACFCKLVFVHTSEHVHEYICAHAKQYWHFILHAHANCTDCIV